MSENPSVGGKQIQAVTDGDVENILGWTVVFTIGPSFSVNREWLEERADALGIDESVLPSKTTNKRAYTRACKKLRSREIGAAKHPKVEASTDREDYSTFNLEIFDRREDGDLHGEVIGQFIYEGKGEVSTRCNTEVEEYVQTFNGYAQAFQALYEKMQESNTGVDIRKMVRHFCKHHSTSVKLRDAGAVYFVPAQYESTLMAIKQLVSEIDREWKNEGFECAVDTIEVIDSADKRDMVQRKVEKEIDSIVDSALDSAFEELDEDAAAEEVVSEVGENLVRAENLAVEHNALLDIELSVQEVLKNWKDSVTGEEKESLVEKAVEEVEV